VSWFVLLVARVEFDGFLLATSAAGVDLESNVFLAHAK
jgi:hypothetical protein